jgi:hypothetical protein
MYRCDSCKNEYESQKRFLAHIERCGNRSMRSSNSRKSVALSDIEETRKSKSRATPENMQAAIEKLLRERGKLKTQIKDLTNDVRLQSTTHKKEMNRSYERFQETLASLTDEKDEEIAEEVDRVRVHMFEEIEREREKIDAECVKKMAAEKKRVSSKSTNQMSRLGSTVENLQERMASLTAERDMTKELHEQQIISREELRQHQVSNLEDQVRTVREALETERNESRRTSYARSEDKIAIQRESQQLVDSERNELRRIIDSYDADKANYKRQYEKEKADSLETLTVEARVLRDALSKAKDDMGRQALEADRVKQEELLVHSVQHQNELHRRNDIAEKTRRECERKSEDNRLMYEGKVTDLRLKYESERSRMTAELDNRTKGIELVNRNVLQAERADADKRVEIVTKELEQSQKRVANLETTRTSDYAKLETALREKTAVLISETNRADTATHNYTGMEKEIKSKIADLEKTNQTFAVQISNYKSAMATMKEDTTIVKDQCVFSLNKQQDEFQEKVVKMETLIDELRQGIALAKNQEVSRSQKLSKDFNSIVAERDAAKKELKEQSENHVRLCDQQSAAIRDAHIRLETAKKEVCDRLTLSQTINEKELMTQIHAANERATSAITAKDDAKRSASQNIANHKQIVEMEKDTEIERITSEKCLEIERLNLCVITLRSELDLRSKNFTYKIHIQNETLKKKHEQEMMDLKGDFDLKLEGMKTATNSIASGQVQMRQTLAQNAKVQQISMDQKYKDGLASLQTQHRDELTKITREHNLKVVELERTCKNCEASMNKHVKEDKEGQTKLHRHIEEQRIEIAKLREASERLGNEAKCSATTFLSLKTELDTYKAKFSESQTVANVMRRELDNARSLLATHHANSTNEILRIETEYKKELVDKDSRIRQSTASSSHSDAMRKMRDDCILALRNQKADLTKALQDKEDLERQLKLSEVSVKEKVHEIETVIGSRTELKQIVETMRSQYEETIWKREKRISELETMMCDAMKKITV